MCRHAVDRSQGGLVEIDIWYFGTDELLSYIADRSSKLRSIRLLKCYPLTLTDEGFAEAVVKLPLLECLEISHCSLSAESLKVTGQSCPNLNTLKLDYDYCHSFGDLGFDSDAKAIAESMPELRHLQLCGNGITNKGLNAILDGCPHVKHLDLRRCFNVDFDWDLEQRCLERIEDLRRPSDYLEEEEVEVEEEEEEVEEEEDDYSYSSEEYVYEMSDDVDNHSEFLTRTKTR